MKRRPPRSTLFPYTPLSRSPDRGASERQFVNPRHGSFHPRLRRLHLPGVAAELLSHAHRRSEEHTSELQSPCNLVCRLLLEQKKKASEALLQRIADKHMTTT